MCLTPALVQVGHYIVVVFAHQAAFVAVCKGLHPARGGRHIVHFCVKHGNWDGCLHNQRFNHPITFLGRFQRSFKRQAFLGQSTGQIQNVSGNGLQLGGQLFHRGLERFGVIFAHQVKISTGLGRKASAQSKHQQQGGHCTDDQGHNGTNQCFGNRRSHCVQGRHRG